MLKHLSVLQSWTERVVDLFFEDGHAVRGRLQGVDIDNAEILYEVIEVLWTGPPQYSVVSSRIGTIAAANPHELIQAVRRE